jgi:hypothetical protein
MGPSQHRWGAVSLAAAQQVGRSAAGNLRIVVGQQRSITRAFPVRAFGVDLVEPCGQSLSQPS